MSVVPSPHGQRQARSGLIPLSWQGDSAAFVGSLIVHCLLLIGLGLAPIVMQQPAAMLLFTSPLVEDEMVQELTLSKEFAISDRPLSEIGADSETGDEMALSAADLLDELSEIPHPADIPVVRVGEIFVNKEIQIATGRRIENVPVRGNAGEGTTGAAGAIDRITRDILLSLEERKTLVVWFFDQSGSLNEQRKQIHQRFDRIYDELGVIEVTGSPAFKRYDDKPLLTSIVAFGESVKFMTNKPTDDLSEIKSAVAAIEQDVHGIERVFTAIHMAAERYRRFRQQAPIRNILFVVFSDEVGDDQEGLDKTVNLCRRLEIPVYVVGIPAPFGKREVDVKWVDPDPNYDQSPQWGAKVHQGPESLLPEVISLPFMGGENPDPMDSGFGPYALTRLCYETGGVYFTVHPNRNVERQVRRSEVQNYTAHLKYFFDPNVMRKYRPDYVSREEYARRVSKNRTRSSLIRAAEVSGVGQLDTPNRRFVKAEEASFANALTEAQKAAALVEPRLKAIYEILRLGESDRPQEIEPRWQASYDLAMGRVLAAKVRAEGYNAMLAAAKRGLKFRDEKNNTWILESANEITTGSQLAKASQQARIYLERVVREHPGTPWALLAGTELKTPLGWQWTEQFTDLTPRVADRRPGNNNGIPPPDRSVSIAKPLPKRSPPKL